MLVSSHDVSVDYNGIVVFSYPELLTAFPEGISTGQNVLDDFITTDLGDEAVDAGLAVPIINIDDGGYVVRFFRDSVEPGLGRRRVSFSDIGFVLSVSGKVYVADAAVFWEWHLGMGWQEVPIPKGNYRVTVEGVVHEDEDGQALNIGYDLILTECEGLPPRTAQIRSDSRVA